MIAILRLYDGLDADDERAGDRRDAARELLGMLLPGGLAETSGLAWHASHESPTSSCGLGVIARRHSKDLARGPSATTNVSFLLLRLHRSVDHDRIPLHRS